MGTLWPLPTATQPSDHLRDIKAESFLVFVENMG